MIEDEGPGIPADELHHATEKFFRGQNKTSVGSGLGLAIAHLAMNRIGGALQLKNRSSGGLSAELVAPVSKSKALSV